MPFLSGGSLKTTLTVPLKLNLYSQIKKKHFSCSEDERIDYLPPRGLSLDLICSVLFLSLEKFKFSGSKTSLSPRSRIPWLFPLLDSIPESLGSSSIPGSGVAAVSATPGSFNRRPVGGITGGNGSLSSAIVSALQLIEGNLPGLLLNSLYLEKDQVKVPEKFKEKDCF